jgi:hypothetical protein
MGRDSPPPEGGSSLGLILGLVFGVIVIGVGIGAYLYVLKKPKREKIVEEDPMDRVRQFYSDNREETEREFEVAYENPVFDTMQALGDDSDVFDNDLDEGLIGK